MSPEPENVGGRSLGPCPSDFIILVERVSVSGAIFSFLTSPSEPCCDVGRDFVAGVPSRLAFGLEVERGFASPAGKREPAPSIEFPRLRPGAGVALHRLLTLSDLFIIALCTKPPSPLVGEAGRSILSGESRPCDGDMASDLLVVTDPLLSTNDAASDDGSPDF